MSNTLNISKRQWLQLVLVVVFLGILGFTRQLFLVNINHQLNFLYYHKEISYVVDSVSFVKEYDYATLMWAKWFLTILYTLLYLLSTLWVMHALSFRKDYLKLTTLLFGGVVLVSALAYGGLSLVGESYIGYRLARFGMGLVQSPIPLMVLVPAMMLFERK